VVQVPSVATPKQDLSVKTKLLVYPPEDYTPRSLYYIKINPIRQLSARQWYYGSM